MKVTTEWISSNYYKYNDELFGGKLPRIRFSVSMASSHGGWAKYIRDNNEKRIYPEAILISNYYDFTEEEAVNVLLHEMIHIEDYTFHPYHFFDRTYDAHFDDFFQSEKNRLNSMGFNITEYVLPEAYSRGIDLELKRIEAERKRIEAEKKKMAKNGTSYIIGILKSYWESQKKYLYEGVWTEEKYMEKVYYGFIDHARKQNYFLSGEEVSWYECGDTSILDFPECKGGITKNNVIIETTSIEPLIEKKGLKLIGTWSLIDRKIFDNDKRFFYGYLDSLIRKWKDTYKEAFKYNYSFTYSKENPSEEDKFLSNLVRNCTDFHNKRNKKEYSVWIGYDKFSYSNNAYNFNLYFPYSEDMKSLLTKMNNLRASGKLDESMFNSMLETGGEIIKNEIINFLNKDERVMSESKIRRIVNEVMNSYIKNNTEQNTDKSIVSQKEIDDGVFIVTQW